MPNSFDVGTLRCCRRFSRDVLFPASPPAPFVTSVTVNLMSLDQVRYHRDEYDYAIVRPFFEYSINYNLAYDLYV